MTEHSMQAALGLLAAGVDAVLSADLSALSAVELTELVRGLEVQRRRLEAADHHQLVEVEQSLMALEDGSASSTSTRTIVAVQRPEGMQISLFLLGSRHFRVETVGPHD